jgi:glycosyltransferase involved in cell wall biosynthesis
MIEELLCSVIIPTYNRAELLGYTLESLTGQDMPVRSFEVLVVDDGSSDATPEVVARFEPRLTLRYFTQPDEGYRVAKARNVGIGHARSDLCVFLDSGVLAHSGCIRAHVDRHARHVGPVAVCGYVHGLSFDDHNAEAIRAIADPTNADDAVTALSSVPDWQDPRERFYAKYSDEFGDLPAPWVVYWTCNASARTGQLRAVGMFDEAYRSWGGEDVDLGYRLHRAGARILLDRAATSVHWPHAKNHSDNTRSVMANYQYLASLYDDPATRLVGRVRLFDLNDELIQKSRPVGDRQDL